MIKALLTIDDIASKNTPEIVDYLVEKGITAIMFAWGENVERYPEEAEYALKNGMIVGNHSYSHPFFSQISFEECVNEIEKCETVLNELYGKAGMERKYRPFRFPYGDRGGDNQELLQKYFRENGFDKVDDTKITFSSWKEAGLDKEISTLWTFDFAEYNIRKGSDFTEEDVMGKIHYVNPDNGEGLLVDGTHHILLLHAHDETEELVPEYYKHFIDCLLDNGVEFISPEFIKI
ncbi:Peptidoglycan/xylan/chitin deacetylase, PgdA/CDA1 family [Lachnospiraceae bacterium]|nr:Peptidoglycan/xylan/chitin deacetylase, PgdA/CDA1 family [Lachnospiraceae bacterium]